MNFQNEDEYNKWKNEWMKTGKVPPEIPKKKAEKSGKGTPERPKKSKSDYKPLLYKNTENRKNWRYAILTCFGVIILFVFFYIASQPKPGDIGQNAQIVSPDGKDLFIATTELAYKAEQDALYAGDKRGLVNLMLAGQLFTVPSTTNVLIIDQGYFKKKVRITSGELIGLSGWIPDEYIK